MGITTCIIQDISYLVKADSGQPFQADDTIEVAGQFHVTIEDYNGTYNFTRGQPVSLVDSVSGPIYNGFVLSSQPSKLGPASVVVEHTLTCTDNYYRVSKQANTQDYQEWYAGDIAVDMVVNGLLGDEGITVAANLRHDSSVTDFATGTLNGVVPTTNDSGGDGCLELTSAGSDLSLSVDLTSGTPTNVTYSGGMLSPTLIPTIKLTSTLVQSAGQNNVYMRVWSGSKGIVTNDTLSFDMFIPSTNKEIDATLDVLFSDSTRMNVIGSVFDQNGLPSFTVSGGLYTDLSPYAKDKWFHRTFTFPSAYNGKTAVAVQVGVAGTSAGTFTAYFQNIVLAGTTLFATNATTFQTTPYVDHSNGGFLISSSSASLVQCFDPSATLYTSALTSMSAVQLVRSSLVEWLSLNPDLLQVYASYDGNSYIVCTNNGALPSLPAGSNVSGATLSFQVAFLAGASGTDPTLYGSLSLLSASVISAPSPTSAKSDVVVSYGTQTAWNTGTHAQTTAPSNGQLTLDVYSRNWNDHLLTGQALFASGSGSVTETASTGAYKQTLVNTSVVANGVSRLDFAGILVDFTLDVDVTISGSALFAEVGVTYRQIGWSPLDATYGYLVTIDGTRIQFGYGANTNTGSQSFTQLTAVSHSFPTNTTIHLKIVVAGPRHTIFVQNSSSYIIDWIDSTYTYPGYIGLRGLNGSSSISSVVTTWDNLVINPSSTGTWTGASTSISTLGTIDGSVIAWTEVNTANTTAQSIAVQTSINGGSTYQPCINGGTIPGLTAGTNVSGKSVLVQAILNANSQSLIPAIDGLIWRVLGHYPGSAGTRSTKPIGIDYVDRADQSGFGTASDGQAWAATGTATAAVTSNKLTITNTTGDFFEKLGTITGTDLDETVDFALSASTMTAGMALRYVDTNNYYLLKVSTTAVAILKKVSGTVTTLKTISATIPTNTEYWMRFRVVGTNPVALYANVWAKGVLEPTIDATTYQWNDNNWIITAND